MTLTSDRLVKIDQMTIFVSLLAAVFCFMMIVPITRLFLLVPIDYNEGWNAFHAARAIYDDALYPHASELIKNNYPPLSFYIVGGLGVLIGDNIIAGRLVSLLSFLVIALNIALVIRHAKGTMPVAILSALLFGTYMAVHARGFIGMNDPQMLAHALIMSGLSVFQYCRTNGMGLAVASALMIAGIMVKHNPLALPAALTLWLLLHDRRTFARWVLYSGILSAGTLLILYLLFGMGIFESVMLAPRRYFLDQLGRSILHWMSPLLPLVSAGIILITLNFKDADSSLIGLYITLAAFECLGAGGAGVDINIIFDLIISLSIAAGLVIVKMSDPLSAAVMKASLGRLVAGVLLSLGILIALPLRSIETLDFLSRIGANSSATTMDIAFIAAQEGPALCESIALCYWAGKEFEVDPFNSREHFLAGVADERALLHKVESRYFGVIQINQGSTGDPYSRFSSDFVRVLKRNYVAVRVHERLDHSTLFIPIAVTGSTASRPGQPELAIMAVNEACAPVG